MASPRSRVPASGRKQLLRRFGNSIVALWPRESAQRPEKNDLFALARPAVPAAAQRPAGVPPVPQAGGRTISVLVQLYQHCIFQQSVNPGCTAVEPAYTFGQRQAQRLGTNLGWALLPHWHQVNGNQQWANGAPVSRCAEWHCHSCIGPRMQREAASVDASLTACNGMCLCVHCAGALTAAAIWRGTLLLTPISSTTSSSSVSALNA